MKIYLTQQQRFLVALIYVCILVLIFFFLGGNFQGLSLNASKGNSLWFYSGVLLVILGKYLAAPYFTKPTDSLANSIPVILALMALDENRVLFGYWYIMIIAIVALSSAIISIVSKDSEVKAAKWISRTSYWVAINLGSSKFLFSLVFLSSIYSYLILVPSPDINGFLILLGFWFCLTCYDVIENIFQFFIKFKEANNEDNYELGRGIGCENPLLYKVEIDKQGTSRIKPGRLVTVETIRRTKSIGMVINVMVLLNKKWLEVYLLTDEKQKIINFPSGKGWLGDTRSIFKSINFVELLYSFDNLEEATIEKIENSRLYKSKDRFIGFVEIGTNLNTLKFNILNNSESNEIIEGSILSVDVGGKETLYQVIDGQTKKQHLENQDGHGYTIGIARKLGDYRKAKQELETIPWMPNMFAPIYNHVESKLNSKELKEIAEKSIGRLPKTEFTIPIKNMDALVTHNTAILGILGIGKSCLTFELINKLISNTETKIICIDITNQYSGELSNYVSSKLIINDLPEEKRKELKNSHKDGTSDNPMSWGNENVYKETLDSVMDSFDNDNNRVMILNPDWHSVTKAGSQFRIQHRVDLTVAEKTRIISERVFKKAMNKGESDRAKYLLVFEEAHSLIPEWNSVANDGDKSAVNGTAKVILQGRKYGLGSMVITQRTANISKSILNQCNTIFALRVFDDTGKQFLENYIGSDYANTLPTLEERHAIAIGKALKLKQPVIVQLNDKKYIVKV